MTATPSDAASFLSAGIHVGNDAGATCYAYPDDVPILEIRTGKVTVNYSAKKGSPAAEQIEFTWALLAAVNDYRLELERLHDQGHTGGQVEAA